MIVQKIFERAGEHPEVIPDIKKMMDYYLPMIVKLLDAYEDGWTACTGREYHGFQERN